MYFNWYEIDISMGHSYNTTSLSIVCSAAPRALLFDAITSATQLKLLLYTLYRISVTWTQVQLVNDVISTRADAAEAVTLSDERRKPRQPARQGER